MKKILAAFDTSRAADSVMTEVVALARTTKARVILLTVVQPPVITSEYTPMLDNLAAITATGEKVAAKHLAVLVKRLKAARIEARGFQTTGAPVAHILEQAKKHAVDYIVMGSHGHTALYEVLIGSTTHGVLFGATCPVVIVPPSRRRSRRKKR